VSNMTWGIKAGLDAAMAEAQHEVARLISIRERLDDEDCSGDPETLRLSLGIIVEALDKSIVDLRCASGHLVEHKCRDPRYDQLLEELHDIIAESSEPYGV